MDGWSQRTAFVASEPPFPALPGSAAYFGWNLSPGHSTERTIGFSNGTRPADTGQAYLRTPTNNCLILVVWAIAA
jgi:hypothetical protein